MKNESSIDLPQEEMCSDIWAQRVSADGSRFSYFPTDEALQKIQQIVSFGQSYLGNDVVAAVHLVGSITSNQYSSTSDIDIHFVVPDMQGDVEAINKEFRKSFKEFIKQNPDAEKIGEHPFEIYAQTNEFQDYMSVGCYDLLNSQWLVGPDLADPSYNPYSDYYKEIQKKSEATAKKLRDKIFSTYEKAVVLAKNEGNDFAASNYSEFVKQLAEISKLFKSIKASRKVMSEPTSKEDALKKRSDRKWKIADASFKLFDKYGYTAILKKMSQDYELLQDDMSLMTSIIEDLLAAIKKHISDPEKLAEREQIDEAFNMKLFAIAGLFAISGFLPQNLLAANLAKVPPKQLQMKSPAVQKAIKDSAPIEMIGSWSKLNVVNIVAWTLYMEGRGEDLSSKKCIASVVYNRAGGDPTNLVSVCLSPSQFSGWNPGNKRKLKKPKKDSDWKITVPPEIANAPADKASWNDCKTLAAQLADGEFKSVIGNKNCYMNKARADQSAIDSWGHICTDKHGSHHYGYQKRYDGFAKAQAASQKAAKPIAKPKPIALKIHIVKAGDTLWSIAKTYKTTVDNLKKKNKLTSNALKIGQKLII